MDSLPLSSTREYRIAKDGIDSLELHETPLNALKRNEVLVKIYSVALNYRDLIIVNGNYPAVVKDNVVPCSDMAGQVVAVSPSVTRWKIGDRVTSSFFLDHIYGELNANSFETALGGPIDGVLTQYRAFPEHALVAIPDKLTYHEVASLPCAGVSAYNALYGAVPLKPGDSVLVQGTGGVSLLALQIAASAGASVIITSSSDAKLEIARGLGAMHTINYRTTPDWDKEVLKLTNGTGVDYVIEVGGEATLGKSLASIRVGGYIPMVGYLAGLDRPSDFGNLVVKVISKAANLRGIPGGHRGHLENLIKLISVTGMKPYIVRVFKFDEAKLAFSYLAKQEHVGKVVIQVADD
ncbi:hypothetical protein NLI96_g7659 [Meripilus lineatus]|uniref:Enoyl reductase (ER) domain-containing protein n=1 Tax=Meripilus lineatus TaxID=2056292 RepID=A0AAD5V0E0_9APHY|nr:hypothetical protein NLI96_g7659 [Physisporinus lineatus]